MNISGKSGTASMNGNNLTFQVSGITSLAENVRNLQLKQFSVLIDESGVFISTPVTAELEDLIPGIIHGARARAKDNEKPDPKPPTGGGDGTPPGGGTPGTPTLDKYTITEARAA